MEGTQTAWYAVRTKSRREKIVASHCEAKGYLVLLPLYRQMRRWGGRNCTVDLPLFQRFPILRKIGITWQRNRTSIFHLQNYTTRSLLMVLEAAHCRVESIKIAN